MRRPGAGDSTPVRSAVAGSVLGVAAIVAAVATNASFDHVARTPEAYGWDWDVMVVADGGYGYPLETPRLLSLHPGIEAWNPIAFSSLTLEGVSVPAVGIGSGRGTLSPTILEGRPVAGDDEIVLGTHTLAQLHRSIAEHVTVGSGAATRSLTIVGRAVVPALGRLDQAPAALGEGIALRASTLAQITPNHAPAALAIRLAPGVAGARAHEWLRHHFSGLSGEDIVDANPPAEIAGYSEVAWIRPSLVAVLALLTATTVVHALAVAARVQHRPLAVLRVLGFTRGQLGRTVLWQALSLLGVAILLGIPIGLVAARAGWHDLGSRLGVEPDLQVPGTALALIACAAPLSAFILALRYERRAAAVDPALVLRSE
jgi:putative ABC transport system permease protein